MNLLPTNQIWRIYPPVCFFNPLTIPNNPKDVHPKVIRGTPKHQSLPVDSWGRSQHGSDMGFNDPKKTTGWEDTWSLQLANGKLLHKNLKKHERQLKNRHVSKFHLTTLKRWWYFSGIMAVSSAHRCSWANAAWSVESGEWWIGVGTYPQNFGECLFLNQRIILKKSKSLA